MDVKNNNFYFKSIKIILTFRSAIVKSTAKTREAHPNDFWAFYKMAVRPQALSIFQDGDRVKFPTQGIAVDVKIPTQVKPQKVKFPWVTRPPPLPILGQTIDRCITWSRMSCIQYVLALVFSFTGVQSKRDEKILFHVSTPNFAE